MSLLTDTKQTFVLMEKKRVPDGAGGSITTWEDGMEFEANPAFDTSMEARLAEKQGVSSLFTFLVAKSLQIEYGDFIRDVQTGETYRVTSNPEDRKTPKSASFSLKSFTAERKAVPV